MPNRVFSIFSAILLTIIVIGGVSTISKIGKKIDVTRVKSTYNEDSTIKLDIIMMKYNRTHSAIDVNVTITDTIDDKYRFELELRVWKDGGWKRNYVRYGNKDPCFALKYTIGKTWIDIAKAAKVNYNCPYYPGDYYLKDYYISVDNVPLLFGSGQFLLLMKVLKNNKFVIGLDVDIDIRDDAI